jgi:uncharacterized membrane protein YgdD (TMEM256/DUF423 family)
VQQQEARARRRAVWLIGAGLIGAFSVGAGAASSHLLRTDPRAGALVATAAQYGIYHALALLALAALDGLGEGRARLRGIAGGCFLVGAALFSVSLVLLAATGPPVFGMATPFGGTLLIIGWLFLALDGATSLAAARRDRPRDRQE